MSDEDSLFGSPPPSPARGRSPSLALPELPVVGPEGPAGSQNVGTIALPGSHDRSELPVFITPASSSEQPQKLAPQPPAKSAPPRAPHARRRVVASTQQPTPSSLSSSLASQHNPKTDRTLRDLVGLISHFDTGVAQQSEAASGRTGALQPSNIDARSHPPGSAQNPIEIDAGDSLPSSEPAPQGQPVASMDAVNSALVALAGTVASALKLPGTAKDVRPLAKPTVHNVLQIIKHDPKLIPVLQATYEYIGSIPKHPQQLSRPLPNDSTNSPRRPFKRKRREKDPKVPAGAGHWDVPFPFPPGYGPQDYPSQWQLDRGRRVLGDLLGLFERAFAQARPVSKSPTHIRKPKKRRKIEAIGSSAGAFRPDDSSSGSGASVQELVPRADEHIPVDYNGMSDWLSSLPIPSTSTSIIESVSAVPSPSASDLAPVPEGFEELIAMFDSNIGNSASDPGSGLATSLVSTKIHPDSAQWHPFSVVDPSCHLMDDVTAFPVSIPEDINSQSDAAPSREEPSHNLPADFVIDPVLMALSGGQESSSGPSSVPDGGHVGQSLAVDLESLAAGSDALSSLVALDAPSDNQLSAQKGNVDFDTTNLSDVHSTLTMPAGSLMSSRVPSRHSSEAPAESAPDVRSPSVVSSAKTAVPTSSKLPKAQRKALLLARAREHRARICEAIEKAKRERWETVIEGGMLRNLQQRINTT